VAELRPQAHAGKRLPHEREVRALRGAKSSRLLLNIA